MEKEKLPTLKSTVYSECPVSRKNHCVQEKYVSTRTCVIKLQRQYHIVGELNDLDRDQPVDHEGSLRERESETPL